LGVKLSDEDAAEIVDPDVGVVEPVVGVGVVVVVVVVVVTVVGGGVEGNGGSGSGKFSDVVGFGVEGDSESVVVPDNV
jgi:hypothetical protein